MEQVHEMDASLALKRRPQGSSDLETAAKFTRTVNVERGQELNDHGVDMQERSVMVCF